MHRAASAASTASALAFACRRVSTGNSSGALGLEGLGLRVLQMPGVLRSFKEAYIDLHKPGEIIIDFHELYHLPLSPSEKPNIAANTNGTEFGAIY